MRHTFTGGPTVDLTSPDDIKTLTLKNLLTVNGVALMSFSLKETDKVKMESGEYDPLLGLRPAPLQMSPATPGYTHPDDDPQEADGSSSAVVKDQHRRHRVQRWP